MNPSSVVIGATRVLIILYGSIRTFDLTCLSIMDNIVRPNYLASQINLVLSFDEPHPISLSMVTKSCLSDYMERLLIFDGYLSLNRSEMTVHREFFLVTRVLDYFEATHIEFDYAIKARFDNYIKHPFPPMVLLYTPYQSSLMRKDSIIEFENFISKTQKVYQTRLLRKPTLNEAVWAYISTGGRPAFLDDTLFLSEKHNVWYLTPSYKFFCQELYFQVGNLTIDAIKDAYTLPLKKSHEYHSFLFAMSNGTAGNSSSSSLTEVEYDSAVIMRSVQAVMETRPVLFLLGSSWVHYGPARKFAEIHRHYINAFKSIKWSTYGFKNYSVESDAACESKLRLAHLDTNATLVDLFLHRRNYFVSFFFKEVSSAKTIRNELDDPELDVWLLRDCAFKGGGRHHTWCRFNEAVKPMDDVAVSVLYDYLPCVP